MNEHNPKIYLLPNLMTAGNLFCGFAATLMVYRIVLIDFPRLGWLVAFVYLVCGALRLARYNCVSATGGAGDGKAFTGFPIPAAAGLIASITLFMLWWLGERDHEIGRWKWVLPPLMLFL